MTIFYIFYQIFPLSTNSSWFFQKFSIFHFTRGKNIFSNLSKFINFSNFSEKLTIFYTFYQSFPLPTNSSWFFENFQFFISRGKIFFKFFLNFATFQTFNKICNLSHFLPNFSTLHKLSSWLFQNFQYFIFMRGKNIFQICLNLSIFQTFKKNWPFLTLFNRVFHFKQIPADFSKIFNVSFYAVKYFSNFF